MKKFLAVFASLAVAATMCLGLAACGGVNGDNSVTTEEEWKAAFKATFEQTGYTIKAEVEMQQSEGDDVYSVKGTQEVQYNATDMISISKSSGTVKDKDGEEKQESTTIMAVNEDNDLYRYTHSENEEGKMEWTAYNYRSFDDAERAYEYFIGSSNCNPILSVVSSASVTLENAYSLFTYDESKHVYTYELSASLGSFSSGAVITVSFKNGLLNYLGTSSTLGTLTSKYEYKFTYNTPHLTVPAAAKAAIDNED